MSTISTKIQTVAEDGIKKAAQDGQSVEQHSIPDLIRAHKHLQQVEAIEDTADKGGGIRFARLISPGTV